MLFAAGQMASRKDCEEASEKPLAGSEAPFHGRGTQSNPKAAFSRESPLMRPRPTCDLKVAGHQEHRMTAVSLLVGNFMDAS